MAKLVDLDNLSSTMKAWIGDASGAVSSSSTLGTGSIRTTGTISIEGSTSTASSQVGCKLQYDSTANCLNFVFS